MSEKKKITHVTFVLDRSGSMKPIMKQAIAALKDNIRSIKENVKETGQDATITLLIFDDYVDPLFCNRSVSSFEDFDDSDIVPRGMTALFDATGDAIRRMQNAPVGKNDDVSYLLNVITDGEENSSNRFNKTSLNTLMRSVQATDKWTLTFLVPPGYQQKLTTAFAIPEGNVMEWENSSQGVKSYATANNSGIQNYFKSRAVGQTNVTTFYTDLSNVTIKEVKNVLEDVTSNVKVLSVNDDGIKIREFIESQGLTYTPGCAYYQLISGKKSADIVQDYKGVFIMSKSDVTKKVYGGSAARRMLNLPDHETKIRPGDHGNYFIFIQSTSYTRKLKAGTKVIYVQ